MRSVVLAVAALSMVASTAWAAPAKLKLDRVHTKVGFTASTLLFDVDGSFAKYDIRVDGDPAKPASAKLSVAIDVASIDTDNQKRDEHLRAPDFFDAKKYPKITFESSSMKLKGNTLTVTGTLRMHGKTKRVTVPFKVVKGKNGAGTLTTAYKGKLTINRADFGVGADSIAAKLSLEDEVDVQLLIVSFP